MNRDEELRSLYNYYSQSPYTDGMEKHANSLLELARTSNGEKYALSAVDAAEMMLKIVRERRSRE